MEKKTRKKGLELLTDREVKSAIRQAENEMAWQEKHKAGLRLSDNGGLSVLVMPGGSAYFKFRFPAGIREDGKMKRREVSFGVYPQVSLQKAREKARAARLNLQKGILPLGTNGEKRQIIQAPTGPTFFDVFGDWYKIWKDKVTDLSAVNVKYRVTRYLSDIGLSPFEKLEYKTFEAIAKNLVDEEKNTKCGTLDKLISCMSQISKYSQINEIEGNENFAKIVLKLNNNFFRKDSEKHYPAAKNIAELFPVLQDFKNTISQMDDLVVIYITMLMNIFVRPGELRVAKWIDVDHKKDKIWRQPAELPGSKKRKAYAPLSEPVLILVRNLEKNYGGSEYLFPDKKDKSRPISDDVIRRQVEKISGWKDKQALHGFRSTAYNILSDTGFNDDYIDIQLGHVDSKVKRAYKQTDNLPQRKKMLDWWSLALEAIEAGQDLPDPTPYQKTY